MGKITSLLFKMARLAADGSAITSGRPKKAARRLINKQVGKRVGSKLYLRNRGRKRE